MSGRLWDRLVPFTGLAALAAAWSLAVRFSGTTIVPGPWPVVLGLVELVERGLLVKYVVASLFRVTWGYLAGAAVGLPLGYALGWYQRGDRAIGPLLQVFRPISPLAWIPLAILWFGVGDAPAVFIIFLGSLFPITITALNAVINIDPVHVNAGRNFQLTPPQLLRKIIVPATIPQVIVGMRLALGVAWLVVVAAEMIAVNSGLGFLIVDARNAGNRYDLVIAGMLLIGTTGIILDAGMRRLETLLTKRWGYSKGPDKSAPARGPATNEGARA
jgi:NitT/TauT family transport system permease protein